MDLQRFKVAQADSLNGFEVAIAELRKGQKRSHWIWYIFPQLRILGRSSAAQFYGIENALEALAYIQDGELSVSLKAALQTVLEQLEKGTRIEDLMGGYTDSLKLVSCCTLFKYALEGDLAVMESETGAQIHSLAEAILEHAEKQGFPECSVSRAALRSGK